MDRLNILILHRIGDPRFAREAVRSLEYMLPESNSRHRYILHDAHMSFPSYLQAVNYDLIVLGPTFLCCRYDPRLFSQVLARYAFIKESQACKVALPQDDYDCSAILDRWMVEWRISRIYTVCPRHRDILYPLSCSKNEVHAGYTCYISDEWIRRWESPLPSSERPIDVSYRASCLPANFGRLGLLKSQIAHKFKAAVVNIPHLKLDISTDSKDTIAGHSWHSFLESSKFCLATPSGSSLHDPDNAVRTSMRRFLYSHPQASFEEIEQNCFSGLDGLSVFSAISPRNIEAALAKTVQIATPGDYSGLLKPMEHYIPLLEDCSNIVDVLSMMQDHILTERIANQCKELILAQPRLRSANIVNEILSYAIDFRSRIGSTRTTPCTEITLFQYYNSKDTKTARLFWARRRLLLRFKALGLGLYSYLLRARRQLSLYFLRI